MSKVIHPAGRHPPNTGTIKCTRQRPRAMSEAVIDHRGPNFPELTREILSQLKPIFNTQGPIVIFPSSGTGAWEAALVNTLSPEIKS